MTSRTIAVEMKEKVKIQTEKQWIRHLKQVKMEELDGLPISKLLEEVKLSMATTWFNVRYSERVKAILLKEINKITKTDRKILSSFLIVTEDNRAVSIHKMSDGMLIEAIKRMLECGYGNLKFKKISEKIIQFAPTRLSERQRIALYGLLNVSWDFVLEKSGYQEGQGE